ncbi:hypothetical protein HC024_21020 [Methylococcaceae bacterium WWC4]|nr:hypothetical protein [Methylococcaceae bacterium WWC4]
MNFGKKVFVAFLLLNSPCAFSEEIDYSSSEQCIKASSKISSLCKSLRITGEFYRVIDTVYQQDFKSKMIEMLGKANPDDPNVTNIDSYEFSVIKDTEKNKYYVGVGAAPRAGGAVMFGSFHYILDATTLEILDKYQRH